MAKLKFILLAMIFWMPFCGWSETSCPSIRLDQGEGCLVGVRTLNQGRSPICYAETAALMMTCKLRQASPDNKDLVVSPEKVWTSIQAKASAEQAHLLSATVGRTCGAVGLIEREGACHRERIIDLLRFYTTTFWTKINEDATSQLLVDRLKKYDKARKKRGDGSFSWSPCENCSDSTLADYNSANQDQIRDQIMTEACDQAGGFVPVSSSTPVCQQYDFVKSDDQLIQNLQQPDDFKNTLHALLNQPVKSASPVAIEYCSGVLRDPSREYITDRKFPLNIDYLNDDHNVKNLDKNCGLHSSAIIGQEMKPDGKCYFLIENSWGSKCSEYANPKNCEDGKIWIEESVLAKSLLRISHF